MTRSHPHSTERSHTPPGRPLRVMFVITCMPVGGAETLLVQLIRRLDRTRFLPELCCLKYLGPLGEVLAAEVPTFSGLLRDKFDLFVLPRLTRLLRQRNIDAVITVGTGGDKMFWGRLAAWRAGVPVIASALHSTGLPDHVEWLNRRLTPITDAFIGVARSHGEYIARAEGCPAEKVVVIPNGVDTERFRPLPPDAHLRSQLGIPDAAPVVGIVAALRPEKNHELFLQAAASVHLRLPDARFLVIGDGPRRPALEALAESLGISNVVQFLRSRSDVPQLLSIIDVLALTSHMEANPVSILEALATETPVVATRVGSVPETVLDGETGLLVPPGDASEFADALHQLLENPHAAQALGHRGRRHVIAGHTLDHMVRGYENMICDIYVAKRAGTAIELKSHDAPTNDPVVALSIDMPADSPPPVVS